MLQKLLIALGFAFALVLSACAPPSDEPNALADAEQMDETEEVAAEEEAAPEPEPEPAPPPVAAKPKPRPAPVAAGAIAGGAAGHEVEKRARGTSYFNVGVNMENGTYRTVSVADASALSVGSRVRVIGENIQLR